MLKSLQLFFLKLLAGAMSLLGRGSSLPGKLACQWMDDQFLERFTFPEDLIIVTGTNGKTSTSRYIADLFRADGQTVMHNQKGSNLYWGLTTSAIKSSNFSYDIQADRAVLEVDEGTLKNVVQALQPSLVVILNLFSDQEDRYGGVQVLADQLAQALPLDTPLLLNGNDPYLVAIGDQPGRDQVYYFGLEAIQSQEPAHPADCPRCQASLQYSSYHYDHLGYFKCSACGLETPDLDFVAEDIDIDQGRFRVGDQAYQVAELKWYLLFNLLALIGVGTLSGLDPALLQALLEDLPVIEGRDQVLTHRGCQLYVNMAKNPSGMNQSITSILDRLDGPFALGISINNQRADGEDASWMGQVDFSRLNVEDCQQVYLSGMVVEDLKQVLLDQGFDPEKIQVCQDAGQLLDGLSSQGTDAFLLANYTAMAETLSQVQA